MVCPVAHFHTGVEEYGNIDAEEALALARYNDSRGISRFSLVTSGRKVDKKDMPHFCDIYRQLARETNLYLCASMGLIDEEEMAMLRDAGVKRYHCNLESAPSFFPTLCTTHTLKIKFRPYAQPKKVGLTVCSGGIIGMGETMKQRIELAMTLRDLDVDSVPINILIPIPALRFKTCRP